MEDIVRNRIHKHNNSNNHHHSVHLHYLLLLCPMSFPLHHQTHDFQEDRYCKGWIPTSCAENSVRIDPKPPYLELKIPWKRKKSPPTEVLVIFIFPFLAPVHMFWRQVYALHLTRQRGIWLAQKPPSSAGNNPVFQFQALSFRCQLGFTFTCLSFTLKRKSLKLD